MSDLSVRQPPRTDDAEELAREEAVDKSDESATFTPS